MAGIVHRGWQVDAQVKDLDSGNNLENVKISFWDATKSSGDSPNSLLTDSSGKISTQYVLESTYSVENVSDITTTTYTPYLVGITKYGYFPLKFKLPLISKRDDIFYLTTNPFIINSESIASSQTKVTFNHTDKIILINANTNIQELYDFCQYEYYNNPQFDSLDGFFKTQDGINYKSDYSIYIIDCEFDGLNRHLRFTTDLISNPYIYFNGSSIPKDITIDDGANLTVDSVTSITNVNILNTYLVFNISSNISIHDSEINAVYTDPGNSITISLYNSTITINASPNEITILNPKIIKIKVVDSSNNPIENARVYLKEISSGNILFNTLTDSNGEVVDNNYNYPGSDVAIQGRVRKASSYPYYKTQNINTYITSLGLNLTITMIKDI